MLCITSLLTAKSLPCIAFRKISPNYLHTIGNRYLKYRVDKSKRNFTVRFACLVAQIHYVGRTSFSDRSRVLCTYARARRLYSIIYCWHYQNNKYSKCASKSIYAVWKWRAAVERKKIQRFHIFFRGPQ